MSSVRLNLRPMAQWPSLAVRAIPVAEPGLICMWVGLIRAGMVSKRMMDWDAVQSNYQWLSHYFFVFLSAMLSVWQVCPDVGPMLTVALDPFCTQLKRPNKAATGLGLLVFKFREDLAWQFRLVCSIGTGPRLICMWLCLIWQTKKQWTGIGSE